MEKTLTAQVKCIVLFINAMRTLRDWTEDHSSFLVPMKGLIHHAVTCKLHRNKISA